MRKGRNVVDIAFDRLDLRALKFDSERSGRGRAIRRSEKLSSELVAIKQTGMNETGLTLEFRSGGRKCD